MLSHMAPSSDVSIQYSVDSFVFVNWRLLLSIQVDFFIRISCETFQRGLLFSKANAQIVGLLQHGAFWL